MVTIKGISASNASSMASLAKRGGTNITVASGWTWFLASKTVLKTGRPRWVWP